jgi:hypothetical protein
VVQAIAFFGGVDLDFREAVLQPGVTEVHVIAFMGGVNITVPEDLPVDVEGIGIFGGFDSRHVASSSGDPAETRLRVTGVAFLGGASVEGRPRRGEVAAEEGARVPARRDRRRRPRRHGHRDDD